MVRAKAWTGSVWGDVRVWDGSAWRAYVPPVFGASFWREDFNAPGLAGFTGGGGTDGTEFAVSNWANVHLYVDTRAQWMYPPTGRMIRTGAVATYQVNGGQTVYLEGSFYCPLVGGVREPGAGSGINLYGYFGGTLVSGRADIDAANNDWGWGVIRTGGYTVPGSAGTIQTLTLSDVEATHSHTFDNMGGASGQYRLYWDWVRVVDAGGTEILKVTTPAVEPLKVWNGTAWV